MKRSAFVEKHITQCPACGKEVLDHMTKCPFCGGELTPAGYKPGDEAIKRKIRIVLTVILSLAAIAIAVIILTR